jgi:hypothetical protein
LLAGLAAGTAMDLVDAPNATAVTAIDAAIIAQIGTLTNTGGGTTLGAILGDPANTSLAQRLITIEAVATETEKHFHTRARWFGKKGTQTATDWADDILGAYRVISGSNAYGTDANDAALVWGTADAMIAGQTKMDMDKIMVVSSDSTSPWKLRLIYGSGTMADAITAGQYTETMVQVISNTSRIGKEEIRMPRLTIGTDQIWCQGWNATNNATLDFYVGIHGYLV